jgi:hypothetical protein
MIDVNAFIGSYPWRHLPHPDPGVLVRVLEREGLSGAWVGHLPTAFHRDPTHGNAELLRLVAPFAGTLRAVPVIRPDWPGWSDALHALAAQDPAAIRAYPQLWGFAPGDGRLAELAASCQSLGLPVVLTARFEDLRQRHPLDQSPDLSAAHVRELARAGTGARLIVTAAGREMVEEVHWGLTPAEREHVLWDISWLWGPPTDDLSHLLRTIGANRFVYGTMWPLRLAQTPRANLALRDADVAQATLAEPGG